MNEDYIVEEQRPILTKRKSWVTGQGCMVHHTRILDVKMRTIHQHFVLEYDKCNDGPLTFLDKYGNVDSL